MKTFLPQNQFNSAHVPEADEAAASGPPLPPDAAATLSVSPGAARCSLPSGESDPSVTLDFTPGENRSPVQSSDGGVEGHAGRHWPSPSFAQSAKPMGGCTKQAEAGVEPGPSEAIMHLEHNAITQAIEVRPHNDLEQLIGVAGKKRRRPPALPRFAPDREAIWNAMFNPDAPRLRADDPVWADAAPLFLGKR